MKIKNSSVGMYAILVMALIFIASCGNSQKKQERRAERRMSEQPVDSVTVIESETVFIAVDSIGPDSVANRRATTPKRTK